MSKPDDSVKITALDTQYTMLVKLDYASVPMNVNSSVGHHVVNLMPVTCTVEKKKNKK
jgi:hypothetical protein